MLRTSVISFCLTGTAMAATWTVDDDGGADFANIQPAVNAASDGDEIIVAPGTYTTNWGSVVHVEGKSLWIHSSDGASVTLIDGEGANQCMFLEHSDSIIDGFTFQHGFDSLVGGLYVYGSDATITNCIFDDNHGGATSAGAAGGLSTSAANVAISNTDFYDNSSSKTGGVCIGGTSSLTNCVISGNTGGWYGGGLTMLHGDVSINQCTIELNDGGTASDGGGGIWVYAGGIVVWTDGVWIYYDTSNFTMTDCTVTQNTCPGAVDRGILVAEGAKLQMYGDNVVDNAYAANSGSEVAFAAASLCTMAGPYSPTYQTTTAIDVDALDATASLVVAGDLGKKGSLSVTNESGSLLGSEAGEIVPLARAALLTGTYESVVFPAMPQGLGLQLIEYSAMRGGDTEIAIEVIEVEDAQFANPFSGDLDAMPVEIASFDADGDGVDEVAVLFAGSPGGVAAYAVSEGSSPVLIAGLAASVGNGPVDLDAADLNGDGLDDLIVANADDSSITVLLTTDSSGALSFTTSTLVIPGADQRVSCAAIVNWDGDADLDAVAGVDIDDEEVNDRYSVATNIATGSPAMGPSTVIPRYQTETGADVVDPPTCVDGGDLSAAWGFVAGTRYGRIHRGISGVSLLVIASLSGANTVTIDAVELDADGGDGQLDLMVTSDEGQSLYLFQGDVSEWDGFGELIPLAVAVPVEDAIALDADADNDMDIVITAPESDTPLLLLRNDGGAGAMAGGLSGLTWSKQAMNSGTLPNKVAGGDLDGKNDDDDWVIGIGGTTTLRGNPSGLMEQTNIQFTASCPGDLNGDGQVAIQDMLLLIAAWGKCEGCGADINGDGVVDIQDVLLLIAAWGDCVEG